MCIRDSCSASFTSFTFLANFFDGNDDYFGNANKGLKDNVCLLYTSDAADERSSVDLGGRRIIKKKNIIDTIFITISTNQKT